MTNLIQRFCTLAFCSIVMLSAQSLPDWVEETPIDSNYYYARENVGVRNLSEEEYKDKANAQAFKTISMQIRTTVSGQSQSNFKEITTEEDGAFIDEFESESSTSTIADIQGAEMVGDYTTDTTYWVLWRLNKSLHEKNTWIYIERTRTKGKLLKLGRNVLLNNNVLVLKFDKYGILEEKLFYDKEKMNEYKFAKVETENTVRRGSFVQSFVNSLRQKMRSNAKK